MSSITTERLIERLTPLSQLIVNEVMIRLKQEGYFVAGKKETETPAGQGQVGEKRQLLNLASAAEMLDHSYYWLSRNYRRLGLKPSRIGGKLLFQKEDVYALIKRQKVGTPGRPRLTAV